MSSNEASHEHLFLGPLRCEPKVWWRCTSFVYHVGDSGYGDGAIFRAAGQKHGGFDLALLPIGAYEPASFMADSHMRPGEAVRAMLDSHAARAMAHHFEAFQLGFEAFDAPRTELVDALAKLSLNPERFVAPRPGDVLTVVPMRKAVASTAP